MLYQNIETERLLLKNIAREDRAFILKQFSDADVNAFLFDAEPMGSLADADELIDFYTAPEPRRQHRWIIVDKQTGEKIGTCGFHCLNEGQKCVDMGYDLQKPFWGRGIMSEALRAVLKMYAPRLQVRQVYAHIAAGNERSARLAKKLGFVWRGETEELLFHGQAYLHHIYVLDINEDALTAL